MRHIQTRNAITDVTRCNVRLKRFIRVCHITLNCRDLKSGDRGATIGGYYLRKQKGWRRVVPPLRPPPPNSDMVIERVQINCNLKREFCTQGGTRRTGIIILKSKTIYDNTRL
jgi:hypothetical protein